MSSSEGIRAAPDLHRAALIAVLACGVAPALGWLLGRAWPDGVLASEGKTPTGVALGAFLIIAGWALAAAFAYRPLLRSTVVNRDGTALYALPETLLAKITWLAIAVAPIAAAVASQWEPGPLIGLGGLFVIELVTLLEITRRRTYQAPADRSRVALDQDLENRKLFLPGTIGAVAVTVWVAAASVVRASLDLETLAYPVGVGAVVIAMFTYYPFLLAWAFGGPDYAEDVALKLLGFLAAGALLVPVGLGSATSDATLVLVFGVTTATTFGLLMEVLRRRALRRYTRRVPKNLT